MLINFLTEIVTNMETFKDDIFTAYVFEESDGQIVACGNHPKMLLLYRALSLEDISEEIEAPAYLGALGYLRSMLGSELMRDGRVSIDYQERDGQKVNCRSMRFFSPGRLDAHFECTDPSVLNDKDRRTTFDKFENAVIFPFTKEMRKSFDEVAKMNTPKSDTRLFTMSFDGSYVHAIFGTGKYTTSLPLSNTLTGNTETKIQKLVSLDRFRPMIKLAAEHEGQLSFHERAVWVDFDTKYAHHTIVTPTYRDQVR